jgi:hypothetical protein
MTEDDRSNQGKRSKHPPLLDREALNAFMATNPSADEAMNFLFSVLESRARLDAIIEEAQREGNRGSEE